MKCEKEEEELILQSFKITLHAGIKMRKLNKRFCNHLRLLCRYENVKVRLLLNYFAPFLDCLHNQKGLLAYFAAFLYLNNLMFFREHLFLTLIGRTL